MAINVLGVCGSWIKKGNVETLLKLTLDIAAEEKDVEVQEMIKLHGTNIKDCLQCNWCLIEQTEGNYCKQKDDMQEYYPRVLAADILILAAPLYSMRTPVWIQAFQNRLRALELGKYYRYAAESSMMDKVGAAIVVAYVRHAGVETGLQSLVFPFVESNWILAGAGFGSPWGVGGLSSPAGIAKWDPGDKLTAAHEEFAIKSARILAKRAVALGKIIKAGKQAVPKEEWYGWKQENNAWIDNNLPWQVKKA